jgi:ATP-dependent Clp protease ATP-binding subunit ClpA
LDTIVRARFARQKTDVTFDPQVVRLVADRGYDPRQGCRRLERVIQREVLEPLAELMYQADWHDARAVRVSVAEGHVTFA